MNFSGEYLKTVDLKGRASIPAAFREELSSVYGDESLVVTKNQQGLAVYPPASWKEICEKVNAMQAGTDKTDIRRTLLAPAQECRFDRQGRIQIPQSLREYAGLEKDIVVVGMFEKIEIWNQQRHEAATLESESRLKGASQTLAELGF